jgi:mono/diheme cytochrome c family protein
MPNRATLAALCAIAALQLPGLLAPSAATDADQQNFTAIERGRYLVRLGDCAACHTDPNGGKPFAGGRPIETPFGDVVSANITPDDETGIGRWSEDQFDNAVRHGIRADGKHLYPAMPYPSYTKMPRADVDAIRAYLATIPPVHNPVRSNQLPFPLNIRLGMAAWNALYFDDARFKPSPNKSAEWNRGAYLVNGPGHCGACHTPKNILGGDKTSQALQGSVVQGWFAPNITGDTTHGIGNWSVKDIARLLHTGHNKHTAVSGPMADEITDGSTHFTNRDLMAIATYLKSTGATVAAAQPLPATDPQMRVGRSIYRDTCSACHGLEGRGVPNLFPALAHTATVRATDPTTTIRVLLRGARSVATKSEPTAPAMPAFNWQLDDAQAAAVLTYVRNSWGAAAPAVTPDQVRDARADLAKRDQPTRLGATSGMAAGQ